MVPLYIYLKEISRCYVLDETYYIVKCFIQYYCKLMFVT